MCLPVSRFSWTEQHFWVITPLILKHHTFCSFESSVFKFYNDYKWLTTFFPMRSRFLGSIIEGCHNIYDILKINIYICLNNFTVYNATALDFLEKYHVTYNLLQGVCDINVFPSILGSCGYFISSTRRPWVGYGTKVWHWILPTRKYSPLYSICFE